jgi:hypothetical protein
MLRDVVPADWDGNYHIHLGGKAGELLFFSGALPAVRAAIPKARVVLHLHPHYAGIVPGLEHQPDEVISDEWYTRYPTAPLAKQVQEGLRWAISSFGGHSPKTLTLTDDNTMETGPYLRHRGSKPFYELFMDACGVGGEQYDAPWWEDETMRRVGLKPDGPPRCALVLASANIHAGSGVREMTLTPGEWEELSRRVKERGWEPVATGHKDDPKPNMPGWAWLDELMPDDVLGYLTRSERVVGFNSGMTFAATRLVPPGGRVTMLDSQMKDQYDFRRMAGVVGPEHVQVPMAEVQKRGYYEVIRDALR